MKPKLGYDLPDDFYLLTLHRAENTDDSKGLTSIVQALNSLTEFPGVLPIHPRTWEAMSRSRLAFKFHIKVIKPVGFFEMLEIEKSSKFFVTDSGGVSKAAFFFGKPCNTLIDKTEWAETVD